MSLHQNIVRMIVPHIINTTKSTSTAWSKLRWCSVWCIIICSYQNSTAQTQNKHAPCWIHHIIAMYYIMLTYLIWPGICDIPKKGAQLNQLVQRPRIKQNDNQDGEKRLTRICTVNEASFGTRLHALMSPGSVLISGNSGSSDNFRPVLPYWSVVPQTSNRYRANWYWSEV